MFSVFLLPFANGPDVYCRRWSVAAAGIKLHSQWAFNHGIPTFSNKMLASGANEIKNNGNVLFVLSRNVLVCGMCAQCICIIVCVCVLFIYIHAYERMILVVIKKRVSARNQMQSTSQFRMSPLSSSSVPSSSSSSPSRMHSFQ